MLSDCLADFTLDFLIELLGLELSFLLEAAELLSLSETLISLLELTSSISILGA
jgi:hypothetical protein